MPFEAITEAPASVIRRGLCKAYSGQRADREGNGNVRRLERSIARKRSDAHDKHLGYSESGSAFPSRGYG